MRDSLRVSLMSDSQVSEGNPLTSKFVAQAETLTKLRRRVSRHETDITGISTVEEYNQAFKILDERKRIDVSNQRLLETALVFPASMAPQQPMRETIRQELNAAKNDRREIEERFKKLEQASHQNMRALVGVKRMSVANLGNRFLLERVHKETEKQMEEVEAI